MRTAPLISVALVLFLPRLLPHDPANAPVLGPDPAQVIAAVQEIPYRIGNWTGSDVPMPESAVRLLRPNATISRTYRNLDHNQTVDFVLVHCGDARDMLGHYPPVCYPNSGWVLAESSKSSERAQRGEPVELRLLGQRFTAQMYDFSRMHSWTTEARIRVFNFFVLPDGSLTNDIRDVRRRSRWIGATVIGVGQVQLLTDGALTLEEAIAAANEILAGTSDVFLQLGVEDYERANADKSDV